MDRARDGPPRPGHRSPLNSRSRRAPGASDHGAAELPRQSLTGTTPLDALGNRRRRAATSLRVRK